MDLKRIASRVAAEPASVPGGMKHALFHTFDNDHVVVQVPDGDINKLDAEIQKRNPSLEFELQEVEVLSVNQLMDQFGGAEEPEDEGPPSDPEPPWDTHEEKKGLK